ncbi:MAG: hypothetical protein KDD69_16160 [Bdellovibrionales bacterium]|nr:hypothetical protein [Bdellovibrionales bacterium]
MHHEYAWLIAEALRALGQAPTEDLRWRPIVEDCPKHIEGTITTAVAFKIAEAAEGPRSPRTIAEAVLDFFSRQEQPWFAIRLGGNGHLNADPTRLFTDTYMARLHDHGADVLFMETPFVVAQPQVNVPLPTLPATAVADVLQRAESASAANPDLQAVLSKIGGRAAAPHDVLMIMALLDDHELEVRPYLEDLKGRQNVPWYLAQFCRAADDISRTVTQEGSVDFTRKGTKDGRHWLASFEEALLRTRLDLASGVRNGRPERILGAVLRLIRVFYSCYNDPWGRQLLRSETEIGMELRRAVLIVHVLVQRAQGILLASL